MDAMFMLYKAAELGGKAMNLDHAGVYKNLQSDNDPKKAMDATFMLYKAAELGVKAMNLDHAGVYKILQSDNDPKKAANYFFEIGPAILCITGLEWAMYKGDWKMGWLFFVNGADPKNNTFNGVIQTQASCYGMGRPDIYDGFNANSPRPIKGFKGLRTIVGINDKVGLAHLWIMECIYQGSIPGAAGYTTLISCIGIISNDIKGCGSHLHSEVLRQIRLVKHEKSRAVPDKAALLVHEQAVVDTSRSLMEVFAKEGLTEE